MVDVAHFGIPAWLEPLRRSVSRYRVAPDSVESLVERLLDDCGVRTEDRFSFILQEALSLRGWAGYVALVEHRPDLLHGQDCDIKPRFIDYMAVRLLVRLCASESAIYRSKCSDLPPSNLELEVLDDLYTTAFHVFSLFTARDLGEHLLASSDSLLPVVRDLLRFDSAARRRIWHLAYERNLYVRALDVLSLPRESMRGSRLTKAQFVFCIDDREESIRRHLEAQRSSGDAIYETYGTAGFFGVDANYTLMSGASDPYCPVIIQPKHAIREVPKEGFESDLSKYRRKQALWFRLSGYVNRGAGSWVHNMLLSLAGCVSLIPMVLGVIAPRMLRRMGSLFGSEPMIPRCISFTCLS
jgi:uncharacterized protein YbcC (UPF0753/DUF2309 family)